MSPEKTIRMANQIARFFQSQHADEAVAGFADHINSFWEPRMRTQLFELLDRHVNGFDSLVVQAAAQIRRPGPQTGGGAAKPA